MCLWFNYFAAPFIKALGIHFSREAKEKDTPAVGAFSPVSPHAYGDDHPVCQSLGAHPEH